MLVGWKDRNSQRRSLVLTGTYLYYFSRNKLGLSEEEFWDSSIEKINDLVSVHGAFNDKKLAKKREKDLAKKESGLKR